MAVLGGSCSRGPFTWNARHAPHTLTPLMRNICACELSSGWGEVGIVKQAAGKVFSAGMRGRLSTPDSNV